MYSQPPPEQALLYLGLIEGKLPDTGSCALNPDRNKAPEGHRGDRKEND